MQEGSWKEATWGRHIVLVSVPSLRSWGMSGMSVDPSIAESGMGYIGQKQYLTVLCLLVETQSTHGSGNTGLCLDASLCLISFVCTQLWVTTQKQLCSECRAGVSWGCNTIASLYRTSECVPSSLMTISLLC